MATVSTTPNYKPLLGGIGELRSVLKNASAEIASRTLRPKKHNNRAFKKGAILYAEQIAALDQAYRPAVLSLGQDVTRFATKNGLKRDEPGLLEVWFQLAQTVTYLSEHPSKKVATIITSPDHMLEAATVNRIPPGIEKSGLYFFQGKRKDYFVCSEGLAIAERIGHHPKKLDLKYVKRSQRPEFARNNVADFLMATRIAGEGSTVLHGRYVFVTVPPCAKQCMPMLARYRPERIYTDSRAGKNFVRSVDFEQARKSLAFSGVPLIDLAPG